MGSTHAVIGICSIVLCWAVAATRTRVEKSPEASRPTPMILEANAGERREFRTRPGTFFTLKVDPENANPGHMTAIAEDPRHLSAIAVIIARRSNGNRRCSFQYLLLRLHR